MPRRVRTPLPATHDALAVRIENGYPTTQIGAVFDAAVLCGVPLFTPDPAALGRLADAERHRLALLPTRVRAQHVELDDDF